MKKIAFYTLGCKVNQSDTASMENLFVASGYKIVGFNDVADIYLINTCVVTNTGQKKSRQIINRAIRKAPNALIVVTGCYPQTAAEEVKAIVGVDLIVGNQDRLKIVELVEQASNEKRTDTLDSVHKLSSNTAFEELSFGDTSQRTRAFLKIQEGCNQYCTYCIIPYARGPLRSRDLENIRAEVTTLVKSGYKEIVLIGIHLGCYCKELNEDISLYDAVKVALSVNGLKRLRLGSLESVEVDKRLLDLMVEDERLCRQLHLPLQTGNDSVLKRMNRPYTTEKFYSLLTEIRERIPNIAITTDVIVGFPGESETDFADTMSFIEKCNFSKTHIFPFSKRKGTPAADMPMQISEEEKQKRVGELAQLDLRKHGEYINANLGTVQEVLFEDENEEGIFEGLTNNYLRVFVKSNINLVGSIFPVKLLHVDDEKIIGEVIIIDTK